MSLRPNRLFEADGRPTRFMILQWVQKGALQPLQGRVSHLMPDRTATTGFKLLWGAAFPDRQRLPTGPIVERDGTGTDEFWNVFG